MLPRIREMVDGGLITHEEVEVVQFASGRKPDPLRLPVSEIMQTPVASVEERTPVGQLVNLLLDRGVRCLPVVDADRTVLGIITDADLLEHTGLHARLSLQDILTADDFRAQLQSVEAAGLIAADIMTADPAIVRTSDRLQIAVDLMRDRGLKRVPVVDEFGHLAGILARLDILRALEYHAPAWMDSNPRTLRSGNSIAELMNRSTPTVGPAARLEEIVAALEKSQQLRVIVVDSRKHPMGIITDGDLLRRSTTKPGGNLPARLRRLISGIVAPAGTWLESPETAVELMTRPVFTIPLDGDLLDASKLMLRHQVKRLPVVDDEGTLVGVLGRGNLMRGLVRTIERGGRHPG